MMIMLIDFNNKLQIANNNNIFEDDLFIYFKSVKSTYDLYTIFVYLTC